MTGIKAVVFDIGNVLLQWHPQRAFLPELGNDAAADAFMARVGFHDWNRLNDGGRSRADALAAVPGVEVLCDSFFNEFTVKLPKDAAAVTESLIAKGVLAGVPASRLYPGKGLDNLLIIAATETNSQADIDLFARALKEVL